MNIKKFVLITILLFGLLFGGEVYPYSVARNNLVGYWSLAEADTLNGSVKDLSGNGNDGAIAVTPATFVADQNGVPNQAMSFDGDFDKLTFGNVGNIKSVACWMYPTVDDKSLFDFDGGTTSIQIASGQITSTNITSPTYYVNGIESQDIILNAWNHIAITTDTAINASALIFGAEASYFAGYASDLPIYSSTLTPQEVSQLCKAGRTTAKVEVDAKNLVVNGGFIETISPWLYDVGWAYGSNNATATNLVNTSLIYQNNIVTSGRTYRVTYTIDSIHEGGFNIRMGSTTGLGTTRTTPGTFSEVINCSSTGLFGLRCVGETSATIGNIEVVDITNAVTPKLQKGLILDMPLSEPYTEGGSNPLSGLCVNYNYDEFDEISSSGFHAIHSTTGNQFGGTADEIVFEVGKKYNVSFYLSLSSGTLPQYNSRSAAAGSSASYDNWQTSISGYNSYTFTASLNITGVIAFFNTSNVEYTVSNLIVKELDATSKDITPNGNNGTVSGATLKYDGLVNGASGIAYVPLSRQNIYKFRAKHQDTGATYTFASQDISGSEGYGLKLNTDGKLQLLKDGAMIDETVASYLVDNTDYQFKTTWSLSGEFNVYIRGGSYGWDSWTLAIIHTDTTYSDGYYFVSNATIGCTVGDLKTDGKPVRLSNAIVSSGSFTTTAPSYEFDGDDDYIAITPKIATAKTVMFWCNLASTTEVILETTSGIGISASAGVLSYGAWDNVYVDGVDTDAIGTGWHHITVTSTTDVDISAVNLGKIGSVYYDGALARLKVFKHVVDVSDIEFDYNDGKVIYQ